VNLQIFGTRKCPDTRKAERFFRERGVGFQRIELEEKGISAGELRSVTAAVGLDALVDRESRRFKEKGLAYQDFDAQAEILSDPLILKTPIVRDGRRATVGYDPAAWTEWLKE
jgi:arsenate reductase-like glutaredoxin family protein